MKWPIPSYYGDPNLAGERLEQFMVMKNFGVQETANFFNVDTDVIESILVKDTSFPSMEFLERFMDASGFIEI
ncbi:hypothetical protein FEK30_01140 (plasmid) [Picosynechococcus sp. PCC 11901]|uniref:hypothetical protein n=1 Tax=Picosynechococcus sp. PCC 11901 TaxID=2579791 RepID=UPI0010FBC914|nr:hypothetical protein [Picosynechococcus sp. PCC 11901]QCS48149.1 hypothetical protein FEK30_01140 [Picosynechococcus sp. PCC 11901]